jgi:hypothetical protein
VSGVFFYVLQAALVQGTILDLNGERPDLGKCLSAGFRVLLPVIAITFLSYVGMAAGMVLLIVPGIIWALAWSVVVPVKVVEQTGIIASFGRSWALTRGHRWKILGLFLLLVAAMFVIQGVVAMVFATSLFRPNQAALDPAYLIAYWLVNIPLAAIMSVAVASLYYELRLVKEGVGPAQLAAAFD